MSVTVRRLALNKGKKKKNRMRFMGVPILMSAYISMTLYGCGSRESQKAQEKIVEDSEKKAQVIRIWEEKNEQKGADRPIGKKIEPQPIDFTALKEAGYEILCGNIATETKSVYEDSWLVEQLGYVFETDERMRELAETTDEFVYIPTDIEYFLFDFNGDGEDEYIVILHGIHWGGRYGCRINIIKRTEKGESEEIFSVSGGFFGGRPKYPFAVLDDRVDGYYSFVLPWTGVVWKYNKETGTYNDAYKYCE